MTLGQGTPIKHDIASIPIDFVVINHNHRGFTIPSTASMANLYKHVAKTCNISYRFDVLLSRESIVSSLSLSDQSISQNPSITSMKKELSDIYGDLFRIPLKVRRTFPSNTDIEVYASLVEMLKRCSNLVPRDWHRFVLECAESRSCFTQDLCDQFNTLFHCESGELVTINLQGQHCNGPVDLSKIPSTVHNIHMGKNAFINIDELHRIRGTQLKYLDNRGCF